MVDAVAAALATVRDLGGDIREVQFPDVTQTITDWFPLCGVETAVVDAKSVHAHVHVSQSWWSQPPRRPAVRV